MRRKHYSELEKLKYTIASYSKDVVVARYCRNEGISRSSIYRWRKIVGTKCFSSEAKVSQLSFSLPNVDQRTKRSHVKTFRRRPRCRPL